MSLPSGNRSFASQRQRPTRNAKRSSSAGALGFRRPKSASSSSIRSPSTCVCRRECTRAPAARHELRTRERVEWRAPGLGEGLAASTSRRKERRPMKLALRASLVLAFVSTQSCHASPLFADDAKPTAPADEEKKSKLESGTFGGL